jgi:hypothetical protein
MDNFFPLLLISFISNLPYLLIRAPQLTQAADGSLQLMDVLRSLLWLVFVMAVSSLASALMLEFVSKKYLKKEQSVGVYINNALAMLMPIMGLSLLSALIVGAGFLAFIIPGIYLALGLSLGAEVLIVERRGVFDAISRSFWLTKGKKAEIFLYVVMLTVLAFIVDWFARNLFMSVSSTGMAIDAQQILLLLTQMLLAPIGACVFILVYFNIRIEKEGFDLEHMADQFSSEPQG